MTTNRSKVELLLIGAVLLAGGCQGQVSDADDSPDLRLTTQAYQVAPWADSFWNLYSVVHERPVSICIELEPGTTMPASTLQWQLSSAVSDWVGSVQPNSSAPLNTTVEYDCPRIDNVPLWDLTVVLHPGGGRAWSHGEVIDLYEAEPLFYETVLHEIGHAFGMGDTYDEANGGCLPNQPPSVMCDSAFQTLQPDDLSGARQAFRIVHPELYQGPRPLTAKSSGRCIDVIGFGTGNGNGVQLWDCELPTFNQVWTYDFNTLQFIGDQSGKCLEVAGYGTENGTPVQLWDCHGDVNQQWEHWTDDTIRSVQTGKCLEVASFGTENGSALQMWDCHGGSNQTWEPFF